MRLRIIFVIVIITTCIVLQAKQLKQSFDKKAFYSIVKGGTLDKINAEIDVVKASSIPEKDAYEATLLMKKAGLVSVPANKIKFFKAGRSKLEAEIKENMDNAEFRFLRLIIQENAPKIVNYRDNIQEDCQHIRTNFSKMQTDVQQEVISYSKTSKNLTAGSF